MSLIIAYASIFVGFGLPWFVMDPGIHRTSLRILSGLALAVVILLPLAVFIDNYNSGCIGAPKDVEFHQGMTICPGQTAHGLIVLGSER